MPNNFIFLMAAAFFCAWSAPQAQDVSLQYAGYVKDGLNGADGLYSVNKVTASPDGKNLYTTSDDDDAVSWFDRDTLTGTLTYGGGVAGPFVAISNFISPDGRNVYVVGEGDGVIRCFARNTATGALTLQGDADVGQNGLYNGMVSPDGRQVYVPSMNYNSITWFSRDTTIGALTYAGRITDNQGGATQLIGAYAVLVSPDGKHVYVSASYDRAITVFARDQATGALTYRSAVQYGIKNDQYMICGASSFSASPDGNYLYVTAPADTLVSWFSRNASTGALTLRGSLHDGQGGVDGLLLALETAVSLDGKRVYVAALGDNALSWFDRDQATGALTYRGCFKDNQNGADHLRGAYSVAATADNRNIYLAAPADSALSWFAVSPVSVKDPLRLDRPVERYRVTVCKDKVTFVLPLQTRVSLCLAGVKGQEIVWLVKNRCLSAGPHTVAFKTDLWPSGLYVCVLETAGGSVTKKFMVTSQD